MGACNSSGLINFFSPDFGKLGRDQLEQCNGCRYVMQKKLWVLFICQKINKIMGLIYQCLSFFVMLEVIVMFCMYN